jgi:hypothetical protein
MILNPPRSSADTAVIVGAANELNTDLLPTDSKIFALNAAYSFLSQKGIAPEALISGDRRFLIKTIPSTAKPIARLVTFDYALNMEERTDLEKNTFVEQYPCLGRDGLSADRNLGFYHGCSSFFLAIQYLVASGYKDITTAGVLFPPPELYKRITGNGGHPEFVYHIQLDNLRRLSTFLRDNGARLTSLDNISNVNIFL